MEILKKFLKMPWTNLLVNILLKIMAFNFNYRQSLNRYLKSKDGWINFSIGFSTENKSVVQSLIFNNGKVQVISKILENADSQLVFRDESAVIEMLRLPPNEVINLLLKSKLRTKGNMNYLSLFNFLLSLLLVRNLSKDNTKVSEKETSQYQKKVEYLHSSPTDKVVCLDNPFLENYSIQDFPRLQKFLDIHFTQKPEICVERPLILTNWYRQNGFEEKKDGSAWVPVLRQGYAFKNLLEQKKPIIRKNDLLGGTTTAKEIGVVLYPDAHAGLLWGELNVLSNRLLNPYDITKENIEILHFEILPYWLNRTFREWVRKKYNEPVSQQLDERFAVYFQWKTVAISHTVPDFPKLLKLGAEKIIAELNIELQNIEDKNSEHCHVLNSMISCLQGLTSYSKNLSIHAFNEAEKETDPIRKQELIHIGEMCAKVPAKPAQTLDEALQSILIAWIVLHMENTNAGLSLGRLDQWLWPYFISDFNKLESFTEKEAYIKHCLEMVGCFFMRLTDHLPMIPDIGNYLFGGSSSDQAITLGGCTPEGNNGVNDMTYILLKVTEILKIRDPNVNARYNLNINSEQYLKRLCEVNLITKATPSIHGDKAVLTSLQTLDYTPEDANDWSATGCVEPTISGKHFGHTGCIMFNLVAAMEMALNQGKHPLMDWKVGYETPCVEKLNSFEEFWEAFTSQLNFLMDNVVEYNNILGEAHTVIRPTPLLSSLIEGCSQKGKDVTASGAKYNSTGTACIGLSDIVDSLMSIKKLVFEQKQVTFSELKEALDNNFQNNPKLYALIMKKVPKFGSGNREAVDIANRVTEYVHKYFGAKRNYRGGPYTTGFWSMSNHVAFGTLTGAMPSGRLAGKAFTPGLTPSAAATKNLLDNLRDVASLNPQNMNNNMAFNVKFVPSAEDTHAQTVNHISAYAKTYFELGGMQMQLNIVSGEILKDAMKHPENYRDLLVRISGYNAYFVTLNKDMQIELIERAEYCRN